MCKMVLAMNIMQHRVCMMLTSKQMYLDLNIKYCIYNSCESTFSIVLIATQPILFTPPSLLLLFVAMQTSSHFSPRIDNFKLPNILNFCQCEYYRTWIRSFDNLLFVVSIQTKQYLPLMISFIQRYPFCLLQVSFTLSIIVRGSVVSLFWDLQTQI